MGEGQVRRGRWSRAVGAVSPAAFVRWLGSRLNPSDEVSARLAFSNSVMLGGVLYGAIFLGIVLVTLWSQGAMMGLALVALAATGALAAVLGFLFGVPRPRAGAPGLGDGFEANANLISVSDWVTKIIIGLSLVQFHRLMTAVGVLRADSARVFGGSARLSPDQAGWFGVCLVLGAADISFLLMCQWTATRLPEVWAEPLPRCPPKPGEDPPGG